MLSGFEVDYILYLFQVFQEHSDLNNDHIFDDEQTKDISSENLDSDYGSGMHGENKTFGTISQKSLFHKMSKEAFINLDCIKYNPLRDRICDIFGFQAEDEKEEVGKNNNIDFRQFVTAAAEFNATSRREQLLKTAFKLQDIDGDGMISWQDLESYVHRITNHALPTEQIQLIISQIFAEFGIEQNNNDSNNNNNNKKLDKNHDNSSKDKKNSSVCIQYSDFQRIVAPTDFHIKLRIPF